MSSQVRNGQSNDDARRLETYGPWAVVTGASDGIGRAFAHALAAEGFHLVLVARRGQVLDDLAAELRVSHEITTRVVAVDLAEATSLDAIKSATEDIDVGLLVAAAGFGTSGRLIDSPLERELEMIDVNCRAVLGLTWSFGRRFVARGHGGIVLMSSIVGFQGSPYAANYAATKAYVQTLAEALHLELAPLGVDVAAVAPGPVQSGFAGRAGMHMGRTVQPHVVATVTLKHLGARATIRPGWLSNVLAGALAPLPRRARVRAMGRIMAGMTAGDTR